MLKSKEQLRRELLERYISTGKVGLTKPSTQEEAIDLIETVVDLYEAPPATMTINEVSQRLKNMLEF